jgi:hypothetical protein
MSKNERAMAEIARRWAIIKILTSTRRGTVASDASADRKRA